MEATPYLSAISEEFNSYLATEPSHRPDERATMARARVLPIYYDWTAVGGIRIADGDIVWVDYDPPHSEQRVSEQYMRNTILHMAGREYPPLRILTPSRPADALNCPSCDGSGVPLGLVDRDQFPNVSCFCGGLGWVPKGTHYPTSLEKGGYMKRFGAWIRRLRCRSYLIASR